ncbi:Tn3 family transposase [Streptomyces anulatus]|uniref:Tn3 family transposase n=1 Tax=Streptomyces anulatus TaxID=1892 RepID=UPI0036D90C57
MNEAIGDVVDRHAQLDLSWAWGNGTTAAADGTNMDTYLDNLLAGPASAGAERVADVGERSIWQEAPPFFSADCGPPARRPSASPGPARVPGGSGARSWDTLPSRL